MYGAEGYSSFEPFLQFYGDGGTVGVFCEGGYGGEDEFFEVGKEFPGHFILNSEGNVGKCLEKNKAGGLRNFIEMCLPAERVDFVGLPDSQLPDGRVRKLY